MSIKEEKAKEAMNIIKEVLDFLARSWGLAQDAINNQDPSKLRRVEELLDELETEKIYSDGEIAARSLEQGQG